jgi:acyl carrier protein
MSDDIEARIRRIMADLFGLDPRKIDAGTSMENVETWDSANHISLVLALEEEFGVSFDVAEFEGMTTYGDVVQCVSGKL